MSARESILRQEALINLINEHQYVPQKSLDAWGELLNAYKELSGNHNFCESCSGAIFEVARMCTIYLNDFKKEDSGKFMTFPEHKKKA